MSRPVSRGWRLIQAGEVQKSHLAQGARATQVLCAVPRRTHHQRAVNGRQPFISHPSQIRLRPLLSHPSQHAPKALFQPRPTAAAAFSTTTTARAAGPVAARRPRQKHGRALGVMMAEQRKEAETSGMEQRTQINDIGILPETFVMPEPRDRPSWRTEYKRRWRLERHRLVTRAKELAASFMFHYVSIKPRPKFNRKEILQTAEVLHSNMSISLARGDLTPVLDTLCSGLAARLQKRIDARPSGQRLAWQQHGPPVSPPRLVSYRAAVVPAADGKRAPDANNASAVVQAVVRLHKRQSLLRLLPPRATGGEPLVVDLRGNVIPIDEVEERARELATPMVEYVVLQSVMHHSQPREWMLWGTTSVSSLAELERRDAMMEARRKKAAVL